MTSLLHHKLKPDGIYVGEVVVTDFVKGTSFDEGNATVDAKDIADKFWEIYTGREVEFCCIGS